MSCKKTEGPIPTDDNIEVVDRTNCKMQYSIFFQKIGGETIVDLTAAFYRYEYDWDPMPLTDRHELSCNGIKLILNPYYENGGSYVHYLPEEPIPLSPNHQYIIEWKEEGVDPRRDTINAHFWSFEGDLDTIKSNQLPYNLGWNGLPLDEGRSFEIRIAAEGEPMTLLGVLFQEGATDYTISSLPANVIGTNAWINVYESYSKKYRRGEHGARQVYLSKSSSKEIWVD